MCSVAGSGESILRPLLLDALEERGKDVAAAPEALRRIVVLPASGPLAAVISRSWLWISPSLPVAEVKRLRSRFFGLQLPLAGAVLARRVKLPSSRLPVRCNGGNTDMTPSTPAPSSPAVGAYSCDCESESGEAPMVGSRRFGTGDGVAEPGKDGEAVAVREALASTVAAASLELA